MRLATVVFLDNRGQIQKTAVVEYHSHAWDLLVTLGWITYITTEVSL